MSTDVCADNKCALIKTLSLLKHRPGDCYAIFTQDLWRGLAWIFDVYWFKTLLWWTDYSITFWCPMIHPCLIFCSQSGSVLQKTVEN